MSLRVVTMLVLVAAVIASAVGVVYARHESRRHFVELNQLTNERDSLNFEFGRLQLEQATWAESNRVDQIARNRLGMKTPEPADIVVLRP